MWINILTSSSSLLLRYDATFVFLGSSAKFKRLLRAAKTPRITRAPRKPRGPRMRRTATGGGSQRKKSCFLQASNFFFSFRFFSEVTRHLAYVIKATSSLLPFLSASYYAATSEWSVIPAQYKTKTTTAQVRISYFHCLMSSHSG
jgi:hypothetical protein